MKNSELAMKMPKLTTPCSESYPSKINICPCMHDQEHSIKIMKLSGTICSKKKGLRYCFTIDQ